LTPQYTRRTIYGKVSRYKLDDYLQLFDFPNPSITAEQRYTTTVPLQRLFFMNSDFVQQQAESLAKRVEHEPNTTARIQKAYRLIFGRNPGADEIRVGMDYLANEPMREYEDRKAAKLGEAKKAGNGAKVEAPAPAEATGMDPDGIMAGVIPPKTGTAVEKKPLLPVTSLGRYIKVLLTSNEFIFIE